MIRTWGEELRDYHVMTGGGNSMSASSQDGPSYEDTEEGRWLEGIIPRGLSSRVLAALEIYNSHANSATRARKINELSPYLYLTTQTRD